MRRIHRQPGISKIVDMGRMYFGTARKNRYVASMVINIICWSILWGVIREVSVYRIWRMLENMEVLAYADSLVMALMPFIVLTFIGVTSRFMDSIDEMNDIEHRKNGSDMGGYTLYSLRKMTRWWTGVSVTRVSAAFLWFVLLYEPIFYKIFDVLAPVDAGETVDILGYTVPLLALIAFMVYVLSHLAISSANVVEPSLAFKIRERERKDFWFIHCFQMGVMAIVSTFTWFLTWLLLNSSLVVRRFPSIRWWMGGAAFGIYIYGKIWMRLWAREYDSIAVIPVHNATEVVSYQDQAGQHYLHMNGMVVRSPPSFGRAPREQVRAALKEDYTSLYPSLFEEGEGDLLVCKAPFAQRVKDTPLSQEKKRVLLNTCNQSPFAFITGKDQTIKEFVVTNPEEILLISHNGSSLSLSKHTRDWVSRLRSLLCVPEKRRITIAQRDGGIQPRLPHTSTPPFTRSRHRSDAGALFKPRDTPDPPVLCMKSYHRKVNFHVHVEDHRASVHRIQKGIEQSEGTSHEAPFIPSERCNERRSSIGDIFDETQVRRNSLGFLDRGRLYLSVLRKNNLFRTLEIEQWVDSFCSGAILLGMIYVIKDYMQTRHLLASLTFYLTFISAFVGLGVSMWVGAVTNSASRLEREGLFRKAYTRLRKMELSIVGLRSVVVLIGLGFLGVVSANSGEETAVPGLPHILVSIAYLALSVLVLSDSTISPNNAHKLQFSLVKDNPQEHRKYRDAFWQLTKGVGSIINSFCYLAGLGSWIFVHFVLVRFLHVLSSQQEVWFVGGCLVIYGISRLVLPLWGNPEQIYPVESVDSGGK